MTRDECARGRRGVVRGAWPARPCRGPSTIRSCTATAATPRSSPGCPSSGSSPSTSSRARQPTSWKTATVTFHPERWTQVYLDLDGKPQGLVHFAPAVVGASVSPCSTATNAVGKMRCVEDVDGVPRVRRVTCARTRTCSTRGSRSQLWPFATQGWPEPCTERLSCKVASSHASCSSPRATSWACGWRAWSWPRRTSARRSRSRT